MMLSSCADMTCHGRTRPVINAGVTYRRVRLDDVLQLLGGRIHKVHRPQHILLPVLYEVVCFLAAAKPHDLQDKIG
jgi:hypothetical protein